MKKKKNVREERPIPFIKSLLGASVSPTRLNDARHLVSYGNTGTNICCIIIK